MVLQELAEKFPVLLTYNFHQAGDDAEKDLIQTLALCGYRFVEIDDIVRAQNNARNDLKDFLPCQIVKIGQCL
ncbi:MAG TPA: hypothetical protein VN611_15235 [Patescibacteria group bacterium]|nr:hypothetical protein [Patescibacteria group bacterium]